MSDDYIEHLEMIKGAIIGQRRGLARQAAEQLQEGSYPADTITDLIDLQTQIDTVQKSLEAESAVLIANYLADRV